MLGKLLKYELKAGARVLPIVYLAIVGIYLIGLLAKVLRIPQIQGTMSFLLIIGGIAAVIMTLVFVIARFHKGLFGAEGYLTQTLPVSKGSLIAAKLITAYLWLVLSFVAVFFAVMAVLQLNDVDGIMEFIDMVFGGSFEPLVWFLIMICFAQLLAYLGEIYFAITLANTRPFIKNNILFAVLFFFGANFAVSILEAVAMLFIPLGISISDSGVQWTTETMLGSLSTNFMQSTEPVINNVSIGAGSFFMDILVGIALLLVVRWLMTHKTSVK